MRMSWHTFLFHLEVYFFQRKIKWKYDFFSGTFFSSSKFKFHIWFHWGCNNFLLQCSWMIMRHLVNNKNAPTKWFISHNFINMAPNTYPRNVWYLRGNEDFENIVKRGDRLCVFFEIRAVWLESTILKGNRKFPNIYFLWI